MSRTPIPPNVPNPAPRLWPWVTFAVIAGVALLLLYRATEPAPRAEAIPAPVIEPTSEVPLLLTAIAGMPGSAGNPAIVATIEPTPTETPWRRNDTPTPWASCPSKPGTLCEWKTPTSPPDTLPTPSPYPRCSTPTPEVRCRMPEEGG